MEDAGTPSLAFQEVDRSTHFLFGHKVFQLKGARFALTDDGTEPALHVELGTLHAALRLPVLYSEFGIDPASPDGRLLAIVARSLRIVKEIRPGDSIPREILDGTASWSVEDRHRLRAQGCFWVKAIAKADAPLGADETLRQFIDAPDTQTRLLKVAEEFAERLDLRPRGAEIVIMRIDKLAREFAYIEALREQCGFVAAIAGKVSQLLRAYRGDRAICEELARVQVLLRRPIEEFGAIFAELDGLCADVERLVKHIDDRIEIIRNRRDDLHSTLMQWEPILAPWKTLEPARGAPAEAAISELYRFMARHYIRRRSWSGVS